MSKQIQRDAPGLQVPNLIGLFQPLPGWLAERLLRADEKVMWVRGPRFNPSWERYVTHPALLLVALAIAAVGVAVAQLGVKPAGANGVLAFLFAVYVIVSTIIVLGISNGYFTRLVVTNFRLVILQGYEVCRAWNIDDLPPSFIHYGMSGDDRPSRAIDLDAVKTLLGGSSQQFTDAKTILSFGKQLDRIKIRDKDRG